MKRVLEILRGNARAICFTSKEPNAFHWQHYGNGGNGVCYEIEDRYAYGFMSFYIPKDVSYSAQKPALSTFDLAVLLIFAQIGKEWTLPFTSFNRRDHPFFEAMLRFLFQKQELFKSEQEVRLIQFDGGWGSGGGLVHAPGLFLRRLIVGPRCGEGEIRRLKSVIRGMGLDLPMVQSVVANGYELILKEV